MAAVAAVLAIGAGAFLVGRGGSGDTPASDVLIPPASSFPAIDPELPSSDGVPTEGTPTSTTAPRATTSTAPRSTATTAPPTTLPVPAGLGTVREAARAATVVYFTYGVPADGYPALQDAIAPSGLQGNRPLALTADYRAAGCTQIVDTITETAARQTEVEFDLVLGVTCPGGAPIGTNDRPLPLRRVGHIKVTVAPRPAGGFWATRFDSTR